MMHTVKRIRYITDMKMMSMLFVFLWHCMLFYEDNVYFEESFGIISPTATFVGNMFDVTLIASFVFCSGYLYALSIENHKRTLLQRFGERTKRLLLPYYLIGAVWLVPLYTYFDIKAFGRPDGAGYLEGYKCMILGQFSDHLWFLWMLFWVALFFILLTPLIEKNMMTILFVITILGALCTDLFLVDFPYFKLSQIAPYLICYYMGILVFKNALVLESLSRKIKIFIAALMLIVIILYAVFVPTHFAYKYVVKPAGALFFLFCFMIISEIPAWRKVCGTRVYGFLNNHQMDIYLIHMPLPYLFVRLLRPYVGQYPSLCILINFTLVLFFGMVLVKILRWIIARIMKTANRIYG